MEKQEQGGPPKNDDRGGYEEPQVLQGMQSGEGGVNQYGLKLLTAPIFLWSFRVPVNEIVRLAYKSHELLPASTLALSGFRSAMVGTFIRKKHFTSELLCIPYQRFRRKAARKEEGKK